MIGLLAFTLFAAAFGAPDRATVVQRVQAELATILKKEAAKLPVDKPVAELGANELDVVEWMMALDEAFRVRIPKDKVFDGKTNKVRTDLSIASMAAIAMEAPPRPGGKKK